MTAHAAQGQTFKNGVVVDLNIGGSSSTMSSYVALTRVEKREDLLIYRPFPLELFNRGQKSGMDLLLRVWRGEDINWRAIEEEFMPSKLCPQCGYMKKLQAYTGTEWKRVDSNNNRIGNCMMCLAAHKADNCPCQCTTCFRWRPEAAFPENKRGWQSSHNRVCEDCIERRQCKSCSIKRIEGDFTPSEWLHAAWPTGDQGKCKACMEKSRKIMWPCSGCGKVKCVPDDFSEWLKNRRTIKYTASARCNDCRSRLDEEEKAQQRKSVGLVVKSSDTSSQSAVVKLERERDDAADQAVLPCKICEKKKPLQDFTMWRLQHGTGKRSIETCNSCLEAKASLHVKIFCPDCHVGKDVDLNLFWKRSGRHRFTAVRCLSEVCSESTKQRTVDKWLRRPQDVDNTIKAWLAHNDAVKKGTRPDTMTVELYKSQIVPERPSTTQTKPISTSGSLLE